MGAHLDDTGDIYDHTHTFFNGDAQKQEGDEEVNYKQIRPDIGDLMDEMDQKVYQSKKVSRGDMMHQHSDSSSFDEEAEEEHSESMEDEQSLDDAEISDEKLEEPKQKPPKELPGEKEIDSILDQLKTTKNGKQ